MKTAFIGSKQLGLDVLAVLRARSDVTAVLTNDDQHDARSQLASFVREGAIVAASRQEAERAITGLRADLVLVAGWYWLISHKALATSRFFGIHHSLLPAYRGGSPLVWALIEGAQVVGTSLFELSEEADAGPVWGQAQVGIGEGYIGDVSERCDIAAVGLVDLLFDRNAGPTEQDHRRASWRTQRHPADGVIDWSRPAIDVQRWIRAQSRPYPGAFTYAGHERTIIWRATAIDKPASAAPGWVSGHAVSCGDGLPVLVEESSSDIPDEIVLGLDPATGAHASARLA